MFIIGCDLHTRYQQTVTGSYPELFPDPLSEEFAFI